MQKLTWKRTTACDRRLPAWRRRAVAVGVVLVAVPLAGAVAAAPTRVAATAPTTAPCPVRTVNVVFEKNLMYSKSCLAVPAGVATEVVMVNEDLGVIHDFDIWTKNFLRYGDNPKPFSGLEQDGGSAEIYNIPALKAGRYFFDCSYHASSPSTGMHGTFWVVRQS